jgi:hypothetical protein
MNADPSVNGSRSYPQSMEQLLALIQRARTSWEEEIAGFSEEQLTIPKDANGWSARDHVAHVAVWEGSLAAVLQGESRYLAMGMDEQTYNNAAPPEGYNEIIYAQHKDRPLEEVLLLSRHAHAQMLESLHNLDIDELAQPYTEYQPAPAGEEEMPMMLRLLRTYEAHYPEHLALIREIAGGDA